MAIVGYAPSSRDKAPYQSDDFEIWGVNELYKVAPRVDLLFELHNYRWLTSKARNPQHLEWLKKSKIPVYMLKHYKDIPNSMEFPIEMINLEFENYFTNSISYMLALAIVMGYKEIHVYGVDMATSEEYQGQRPSVEYFVGLAQGRGIKVHIPNESDLLKTFYQYGYDDFQITKMALKFKARKKELQDRIKSHEQQSQQHAMQAQALRGALDDTHYFERTWLNLTEEGLDENN